MIMKIKFALALVAVFGFATLPAFAQHGHGGGSSGASSMHGDSHSSGHDANEANEANDDHGGHDATAEANEHSGRHGGHDSSHGGLASKLSRNTQLASKLQALLPPGTDLQQAAQGFKNLGQFVAAVHASKDLGIPFDQLKAKMTGPGAENLGKAIRDLDPGANAKAAAKQAEQEAKSDIKSTKPDNDQDADKNTTSPPPAS
jgi:hypothetical protein